MARVSYQKRYIDEIIVSKSNEQSKHVIEATPGYEFDKYGECTIEMHFYDGLAIATDGSGIVMRYPTLAEIKGDRRKKEEITTYTDRDDITQYEVALKYGHLERYKMVADYNLWSMQDDNDQIDITAIYDSKGTFLFDVLEDDYKQLLDEEKIQGDEDNMLTDDCNGRHLEQVRMKYGVLWTEHVKDDIIK